MIRKGSRVTLIRLPIDGRTISRLKVGMVGEVLAIRPAIDNHCLVKWSGKSGPVSHDAEDLKEQM